MTSTLARFGVAMDESLLDELDELVQARKTTRSRLIGDLTRTEVMTAKLVPDSHGVMTVTLVCDRHAGQLTKRVTMIQHELGGKVRSTLRVRLSRRFWLEVIVVEGKARELQLAAGQLLATRGVRHGGVKLVTDLTEEQPRRIDAKRRCHL
jgi:CopG family nickel-responsive transcriptional regulator